MAAQPFGLWTAQRYTAPMLKHGLGTVGGTGYRVVRRRIQGGEITPSLLMVVPIGETDGDGQPDRRARQRRAAAVRCEGGFRGGRAAPIVDGAQVPPLTK